MFIKVKDAKKQYGAGEAAVYALDGVDLSLEKGKICVICAVSAGLLGLVAFEIVKSLAENYERNKSGVRCECIGDCSKCRIQCQSNSNYYGIHKKGEPK